MQAKGLKLIFHQNTTGFSIIVKIEDFLLYLKQTNYIQKLLTKILKNSDILSIEIDKKPLNLRHGNNIEAL